MRWTKDKLWDLRQEIRLNSLYTKDYENSFGVNPSACQDFFDSFVDYYESERYEKDSPYYQSEDDWFFDNPEDLWNYYLFYEDEPLPVTESKRVKEAYWENENNPKKAYKTIVKYKLFKDDDTYVGEKENGYYVFEDTYYIDSDYSADEVSNYIINDALLVCGGGYSKKNIKEAIVKINGRVVYKFDNSKTESKRSGKKNRLGEVYRLDDGYSIDTWDVINGLKKYCSAEHDLDAVEEALYNLEVLATTEYNKDTYEPLYRFLVDASGNL